MSSSPICGLGILGGRPRFFGGSTAIMGFRKEACSLPIGWFYQEIDLTVGQGRKTTESSKTRGGHWQRGQARAPSLALVNRAHACDRRALKHPFQPSWSAMLHALKLMLVQWDVLFDASLRLQSIWTTEPWDVPREAFQSKCKFSPSSISRPTAVVKL
eukprot:1156028-Pelagomonas_calceolata.AAC.1